MNYMAIRNFSDDPNCFTLQVNISAAEREKIESEIKLEGDMFRPDLFDDAQQQVFVMLKNDLYPRFR